MVTKHVFWGKYFGKIGFWTFFLSIFDFPKILSREKTRMKLTVLFARVMLHVVQTATPVLHEVRTRCLTPCNCRQAAGPWDHL
jgi:hypothetical protein